MEALSVAFNKDSALAGAFYNWFVSIQYKKLGTLTAIAISWIASHFTAAAAGTRNCRGGSHLLAVVRLGDEAEDGGDGLHQRGHGRDGLQLAGQPPPRQHARRRDDRGVEQVHHELREAHLAPRHAPQPEGLQEGFGDLEDGVRGGVHRVAEEALLEVRGSVAPGDGGAQRHRLAHLPLAAGEVLVIQTGEIVNNSLKPACYQPSDTRSKDFNQTIKHKNCLDVEMI